MKKKAAKGTTRKHAGTAKHQGTSKHHPTHHKPAPKAAGGGGHQTAVAKHPTHAKARTLSPGDVGCCSAEALAASLRLAGWPVGDDDVLALYRATVGASDAGASILATLEAAAVHGLAGIKPVSFAPTRSLGRGVIVGTTLEEPHAVTIDGDGVWTWGEWHPSGCGYLADAEEAWSVVWPSWL